MFATIGRYFSDNFIKCVTHACMYCRTKFGVDIIFVGDKNDTIHALTCLIKTTNQWMDYMENIIEISTVGQGTEPVYDVRTYNHRDCPYRLCDMPLPSCNSGFVYMLISCKDPHYSYIGETQNISTCLNQHNQGRGAKATTPESLRPYSLFAYICGFDGRTQMRQNIEYMWKLKRAQSVIEGVTCMKSIARLAADVIRNTNNGTDIELRLVLNFED